MAQVTLNRCKLLITELSFSLIVVGTDVLVLVATYDTNYQIYAIH